MGCSRLCKVPWTMDISLNNSFRAKTHYCEVSWTRCRLLIPSLQVLFGEQDWCPTPILFLPLQCILDPDASTEAFKIFLPAWEAQVDWIFIFLYPRPRWVLTERVTDAKPKMNLASKTLWEIGIEKYLSVVLWFGFLHWAGDWIRWPYQPLPIQLFYDSMKYSASFLMSGKD